jgi:hypothetical protein
MRMMGVVSSFWLIQFVIEWYRAVHLLWRAFPDHHISFFPVIESLFGLALVLAGLWVGLSAKRFSGRFPDAAAPTNSLSLLIGLAAALYMAGYVTRTTIQLGAIESLAGNSAYRGYGGSQRAKLEYYAPTTLFGRFVAPGVALGCVALMGFGCIPPKRVVTR